MSGASEYNPQLDTFNSPLHLSQNDGLKGNKKFKEGMVSRAMGSASDAVWNSKWGKRAIKFGNNHKKARAVSKTAIRGVKAMGKGAWKHKGKLLTVAKAAASVTTAGVGAGIGLAAGIATGDPSKAFSYAVTGLTSGALIGNNAVDLTAGVVKGATGTVAKGAQNGLGNIKNAWNEEYRGIEEADKIRKNKEDTTKFRQFMKDEDQLKQAKKLQVKLAKEGQDVSMKDIMRSRYDYIANGITNEEEIKNAQLAEAKEGGINGSFHDDYVDTAITANKLGISTDTFIDPKKYNQLHNVMSNEFNGEEKGERAMQIMARIKGQESQHNMQSENRKQARLVKEQTEVKAAEAGAAEAGAAEAGAAEAGAAEKRERVKNENKPKEHSPIIMGNSKEAQEILNAKKAGKFDPPPKMILPK